MEFNATIFPQPVALTAKDAVPPAAAFFVAVPADCDDHKHDSGDSCDLQARRRAPGGRNLVLHEHCVCTLRAAAAPAETGRRAPSSATIVRHSCHRPSYPARARGGGASLAHREVMNESRDTDALSVTDAAKGIAVRAGVLTVVTIIVGTWLFSLAAKAASGLVKIVAGVLLLAIGGGVAAWEVRKIRKHMAASGASAPALP
jgi:hypothetical protein